MGEMIDRLAGFISHRRRDGISPQVEARMTLELLREPTQAMSDAGDQQQDHDAGTAYFCGAETWRRMIDAA